jgi:transposase
METFIRAALDRDQQTMFRETLEESIPANHAVRMIDEIVDMMQFEKWEREYQGGGRPSYAPRDMLKLFVYGNMQGVRSSRKLEYACMNNKDFIWLMRGLEPDHDTISEFRRRNAERFKEMFKETVRIGLESNLISMRSLAIDGSRVRSNSSRWHTVDERRIEEMLEEVEARMEEMIHKADEEDKAEDDLYGKGGSPNRLPSDLADLRKRKERLEKAYERVKEKARRAKEAGHRSDGKRVPLTDTDSDVMKCKEGGFAPNYNVHLAVDTKSGMIVSEGVSDEHTDGGHLQALCEASVENTGIKTEQVIADSAYTTVENLEYLEGKGIDACMPPIHTSSRKRSRKEAEWPEDVPTEAVRSDGEKIDATVIPRDSNGKFDKSAFAYDESRDSYICPLGHEMFKYGKIVKKRRRPQVMYRYKCGECSHCQFKSVCTVGVYRTIYRNKDASVHERHMKKMQNIDRQITSRIRGQTVEPAFGTIKEIHRLRMFLTRGLESVKNEWTITSIAYNVRKLIKQMSQTPQLVSN